MTRRAGERLRTAVTVVLKRDVEKDVRSLIESLVYLLVIIFTNSENRKKGVINTNPMSYLVYSRAKAKGSICLLVKWADTVFWLCRAV